MKLTLNKFIAYSGICSRRNATDLIKTKQVKVNGQIVKEPFYEVQSKDSVKVKNKLIQRERLAYYLFSKPKDVICTLSDPEDRTTITRFFHHLPIRLYPIGRLDRNTTGLIIMTNDGDLTQKLSHPSFEISKTYHVNLHKPLEKEDFERIQKGIHLEDGFLKVDTIRYGSPKNKASVFVKIHSGKKHVIKNLFQAVGYFVEKLNRTVYAGLRKGRLAPGEYRSLTPDEVKKLKSL